MTRTKQPVHVPHRIAFRPKNLRGVALGLTMKALLTFLGLVFLIAGCATRPRGFPAREGIANFDLVNEHLYRGAQPNALGIANLERLGIKTIINLRMPAETWATEDKEASRHGITYTNVPMKGFGRPTDEQVANVLSIINASQSPIFIHCQHGCDRTGTIIACYRIAHDGWTSDKALTEARLYGMSAWELGMKNYVRSFGKDRKAELK
jgi:uncharacterized protein (TIGR01244 family)